MSQYPLITLGIPIYNAVDLIERTLLSVLNQTYPNIEYLFIDDKGNSMDIVRRVVDGHPRRGAVRIVDQVYNQGIGAARNVILDNATGEYLFTMDCDDVIVPNCIEVLYNKMVEHPVDFVAASFVRVDLTGKQYPGCQYTDILIEGTGHPVAQYRYGEGQSIYVAGWNKLYVMDFLRKHNIRCKAGHFNEDPWFTYQVIINASSCRLLPDCTLYYTYNPESVTGISAARGYSVEIARQYVDIEKLKSLYIRSMTCEPFYRGLLTDIMLMSIYFAYRMGTSPLLNTTLRNELQGKILTRSFERPGKHAGDRNLKYIVSRCFFALPLGWKRGLINFAGFLKIKDFIHRWIHF